VTCCDRLTLMTRLYRRYASFEAISKASRPIRPAFATWERQLRKRPPRWTMLCITISRSSDTMRLLARYKSDRQEERDRDLAMGELGSAYIGAFRRGLWAKRWIRISHLIISLKICSDRQGFFSGTTKQKGLVFVSHETIVGAVINAFLIHFKILLATIDAGPDDHRQRRPYAVAPSGEFGTDGASCVEAQTHESPFFALFFQFRGFP
jgi:hypothetical protein